MMKDKMIGQEVPDPKLTLAKSRMPFIFLLQIGQLLLILKVIQIFAIEERRDLLTLMCLVTAGFIIHRRLADAYRAPLLVALTLLAFIVILGWSGALACVSVGALLMGVCHLPIPIVGRGILLLAIAAGLAYWRTALSAPWWPILGSLF